MDIWVIYHNPVCVDIGVVVRPRMPSYQCRIVFQWLSYELIGPVAALFEVAIMMNNKAFAALVSRGREKKKPEQKPTKKKKRKRQWKPWAYVG